MEPAAVSPGSSPILVTRDLTKSFRRLTALKNHSVEVKRGEIVGVIGPNGSGKSTFFNVVTGFQRPNAGSRAFRRAGRSRICPAPKIVRLGIARTFQGTRLFPAADGARERAGGGAAAPSAWFRRCRLWPAALGPGQPGGRAADRRDARR